MPISPTFYWLIVLGFIGYKIIYNTSNIYIYIYAYLDKNLHDRNISF